MQLKSIDKYIKDKVQGYKPEYQADLWKGIEEKLPAARVPNGRGSWMLTVAAIATIAVLSPFIIKFYNLTGNRAELAIVKSNVGITDNHKVTDQSNNTDAGVLVSKYMPSTLSKHHIAFANSYNNQITHRKAHEYAQVDPSQVHGNGIRNNSDLKINDLNPVLNEQVVLKQADQRELMTNIFPAQSNIQRNGESEISDENNIRYPDRKNKHPLNDTKWNDWQSIFYPFWKNPAYTGSEGMLSFTSDYKTDNTISEPVLPNTQYTYFNIGADGYLPALGLGFGLYRLSELSPYSLQNTVGFAISKAVLQVGSTSIKIGLSGTSITNNLFFGTLNYSDQIDPNLGFWKATKEKSIQGTTQVFGVNGGLWISNPHVMAGLDVTNANQPKPGFGSDATPLPRVWRGCFGYRFAVSSDLQFMPMTIITRENKINQANVMVTAVFKDKYMLAVAYKSIDPTSGWGNPYIYGAVNIVNRFRVFASYGTDTQLAQMGINENFIHCGIKYQAIR